VTESKLDKVRRLVTRLINRYRDKAKRYYDVKRREVEYAVGDLVWKRSYRTTMAPNIFAPSWQNYSWAHLRIDKNVYALVDDIGVFKGKWHVKDLKPDHTCEREDDRDSSSPEFAGREYKDSDGDSDTSSDQ
jgi:hypothetical protein